MTTAPTLFLPVGLPGTGKTTQARRIEVEEKALRLTKDEWVKTWRVSDEELAGWAATITIPTPGELDGSEPVDDPPAGFATWEDWRRHRWPASIFWSQQ